MLAIDSTFGLRTPVSRNNRAIAPLSSNSIMRFPHTSNAAFVTTIVAVSTSTARSKMTCGVTSLFLFPMIKIQSAAFHTMTRCSNYQNNHLHDVIYQNRRNYIEDTSSSTRLFSSSKKRTKKRPRKKSSVKKTTEIPDSDDHDATYCKDNDNESLTSFSSPFATSYHAPVMWRECIQALLDGRKPEQEGENATPLIFIDGTLGGGGHCQALLESLGPGDVVFGCDRDTDALETAAQRLSKYTMAGNLNSLPLFIPVQSNFAHLTRELLVQNYRKTRGDDDDTDHRIPGRFANLDDDGVDGILLDLGLSSYQIDTAERGFAFMQDGPLDMRMGKNYDGTLTAADICNEFDFVEIQKLLRVYGDEPRAKRIALSIIEHRPLRTTVDLQNAVAAVTPEYSRTRRMGRTATLARVFQSLRIAVNQEDVMLERALTKMAPSMLRPGGRLVVLSYQSMEDRLTKRVMRDGTTSLIEAHQTNINQRDIYGHYIGAPKPFRPIGKPIKASDDEVESNVRARSATLRIAEKQQTMRSTNFSKACQEKIVASEDD